MAAIHQINAQLAAIYGKRQVIMTRGRGYYYFRGEHDHALSIPSIYQYSLDDTDVAPTVQHVRDELDKPHG